MHKLIESWQDVLTLLILIALSVGFVYVVFFMPGPDSVCTTGTGKELVQIFQDYLKSL